ncbi:MAG: gliding motility lipoprotein GldH [Bacteroidales bacterium]|nr:gliding motility lipoprotein GldH [Bacteroidales bacterium]
MKRIFLLTTILIFSFASCRDDKSVSRIHNFTNANWQRFEFLNFEFQIDNADTDYNILVLLRYTNDFPSQALIVNLVMNLPSGEERIREYKLNIRDDDGELLGEKKAGYYERFIDIRKEIRFGEPGLLKCEIENLMTKYYTPGVVEFGIVLEPAK